MLARLIVQVSSGRVLRLCREGGGNLKVAYCLAPQGLGLSPTGVGKPEANRPEANRALIFKLYHPVGAFREHLGAIQDYYFHCEQNESHYTVFAEENKRGRRL
jgi:hypothetical protein